MSDELKHECAVAMVVLRKPCRDADDCGGTKLSLLLEKQHNRGQDGAGAAILSDHPTPGEAPYWIAKSASSSPLTDVLGMIGKRHAPPDTASRARISGNGNPASKAERVFLGHLRYATFGKNDVAFCHPFIHESSELAHTLLLAGNFNLTNAHDLFDDYSRHGSFPTSKADGYLICELIAHELAKDSDLTEDAPGTPHRSSASARPDKISRALSAALANADGAWTLCGMTGDGWAFATRDPHGIRPGFYYFDENVTAVASERPAIQAAFDVPPEAVKELPAGHALVISPDGEVLMAGLADNPSPRPCSFERIYFSRANDADIHRERKALGAALVPQILKAADAPPEDIFFSYIPNSARISFHGLLEELFARCLTQSPQSKMENTSLTSRTSRETFLPRFGEIAVKDAKFRTFIADAAARREFYKHVYDVTYGLLRPGRDTLVVLDDSIVRGNTMKNAILPMLDRLGPKRIVIASSAPPIRYPDCYGIDMSTLGELVAFKALVNLLGEDAGPKLQQAAESDKPNPLAPLYASFAEERYSDEIARLLTPPGIKTEVKVVYQTIGNLRRCLAPAGRTAQSASIGDWYFTGEYPTPGGYKVLHKAIENYLEKNNDRSY